MRKYFTHLAFALLAFGMFGTVQAGSGGPDLYGYIWRDSNEPNGPVYSWRDITTLPGAVQIAGLSDDNSVGPFAIGWDFHYYWTDNSNFKFGSNGWVGFNNIGNIAHCFPTVPSAGGSGDNFLAPFMSDLNYSGAGNPGNAWYWSNLTDTLIIQYNQVPWWINTPTGWAGSNTFQVILSGVDSSITFMYNDTDAANFNDIGTCAADLEIGMENITGNIGLEVLNETVPPDNFAIKFYYPGTVTFQVPDATPAWNANVDNGGQIFFAGSNVNLQTNIANVGNADITSSITINGQLQNLAFSTIWTDQASLPSGLATGTDTTITFSTSAGLPNPGQYYYNVTSASQQDINPSNNNNVVEISVVACANDTFTLSYATGNNPDGAVAWSGGAGNDGAGVYYESPVYPITLEAVDLFILGDGDPNTPLPAGFFVKIYDDSGLPGALIDSVFVPSNGAQEFAWNRIPLSTPYVLNSGGVYVSWIMEADGIALGTETIGPISQRTYEILAGQWASYRQLTAEDFLLRLHSSGCDSLFTNTQQAIDMIGLETYPNPTAGIFKVRFDLPAAGAATFSMMDLQGRTLFTREEAVSTGSQTFTYDGSELAPGVYFLRMDYAGQSVSRRVLIAR